MQTSTTPASTIIPMNTTPPTAPPTALPTAVISTFSVAVVGLTHSVCAINEFTSIGQLEYTLV